MPLLGMGSFMTGSSSDIPVPSMLYHDLTTWHTINNNYTPSHISHVRSIQAMAHDKIALERLITVLKQREGHRILDMIEKAKQSLSDASQTNIDLSYIESNLEMTILRSTLNAVIEEHVNQIIKTILETVNEAHINCSDVNAIFYTGGSTKIPLVRDKVNALFPNAEVIQGDAFGSVGLGLTIDAQRKHAQGEIMIRAFFAINLPEELQKSMDNVVAQLNTANKLTVQWIKPQNLHITLQFMKNVELKDISTLSRNVRHELQSIQPFELELSHLELFPEPTHPRLISVALASDVILVDIAKRIGRAIVATNYPLETRPFRAHLTLGRFKETPPDNISLIKALPNSKKFLVKEIIFYQSHRSHEGSYYTPLEKIVLKNLSQSL
jgi:2'-5' RNA ligase